MGHKNANNGLAVIDGNGGSTNYRTMSVSGNLQLKKGQYASVYVYSSADNYYTVNSESGFSCNKFSTAIGFRADKQSTQKISKKGYVALAGSWRTNGELGLYSATTKALNFDAKKGQLTLRGDGIYFCSAQVRVDSAKSVGLMRLLLAHNNKLDVQNGFSTVEGAGGSTNERSMGVAGTIQLGKGDVLNIYVYSSFDNSYSVSTESGWGCHQMGTQIGFHVNAKAKQAGVKGWSLVHSWAMRPNRARPGMYVKGGRVNDGYFAAPVSGDYTCSVQMRFDDVSRSSYMRVILAVNAVTNVNLGFTAIEGNGGSSNYRTMCVP